MNYMKHAFSVITILIAVTIFVTVPLHAFATAVPETTTSESTSTMQQSVTGTQRTTTSEPFPPATTSVESSTGTPLIGVNTNDPFFLEYIGSIINLGSENPIDIVTSIINILLGFLGIIFLVLVLFAGLQFMLSMGDPERTKKAGKTLVQAVVGLAIMLLSYTIVQFIFDALTQATL